MWYDSFRLFINKIEKTFKLQKELLKTEMDHKEKFETNWKQRRNGWLPYVKKEVLCTAFSYARYSKAMLEITSLV